MFILKKKSLRETYSISRVAVGTEICTDRTKSKLFVCDFFLFPDNVIPAAVYTFIYNNLFSPIERERNIVIYLTYGFRSQN